MDGEREELELELRQCRIVVGDGKTPGECASLVTGWCASANPCWDNARAADGQTNGRINSEPRPPAESGLDNDIAETDPVERGRRHSGVTMIR